MDISAVSLGTNLQKDVAINNAGTATGEEFKTMLEQAAASGDDKKLKEACDELETYMLSMVFKQTKKSMLSDDENSLIPKGDYIEMFEDTMIDAIAGEVVKAGGVGLSDTIYRQMQKSYGTNEKQASIIDQEI